MPWELGGNAGTDPDQDFLGTADDQPLVIKAAGAERLRLDDSSSLRGDLTVGAGSAGFLRVRHIYGKSHLDDGQDVLYLNWDSGKDVWIGGHEDHTAGLVVSGNVTVGAGGNASLQVRHIYGKSHLDDGQDVLYLNWDSGKDVWIGGHEDHTAGLVVSGNVTVGAGGNASLQVRHIYGKSHLDDGQDVLYLNWDSGKDVWIGGHEDHTAGLVVSGNVTVGAGGNASLQVRHIYGKSHLDDGQDALYLNWGTGKPVVVGNNDVPSSLEVTGDVVLKGADCAEEFSASDPTSIEPGTVVALADGGQIVASKASYDSRVVGVIAGAGEYRPAIVLDRRMDHGSNRFPVTLVGKTFCKVDADYAPIEVGDLLTTSATRGHAMKAVDSSRSPGAILGKALRAHRGGRGLLPIVACLQ